MKRRNPDLMRDGDNLLLTDYYLLAMFKKPTSSGA